jgi:hypothetical protein
MRWPRIEDRPDDATLDHDRRKVVWHSQEKWLERKPPKPLIPELRVSPDVVVAVGGAVLSALRSRAGLSHHWCLM